MNEQARRLRLKTYGAIFVVALFGAALAAAGRIAIAAVGVPVFLSLLVVEYAGARAALAAHALRLEIEALRARLPASPA